MEGLETWQAVLLGLLQGITEFLPVSSSGHLRVGAFLFGIEDPQSLFDVGLHFGTLIVVVAFFWRDVVKLAAAPFVTAARLLRREPWADISADPGLRGAWFVILGSIPTGALGILLGPHLEGAAVSLHFVAIMFLVNSLVLFGSRYLVLPLGAARMNTGFRGMRWHDAVVIGIAQGLSVARGISRSGSTISAALVLGVDRETAGRYSFLLSIPAILGATLVSTRTFAVPDNFDWTACAVGVCAAMVSGALCLHLLMRVVKRGKLHHFGWYTLFLGITLLLWLQFGAELSTYWEAAFHGTR
jgi:undecaprenyl-diphosphatase